MAAIVITAFFWLMVALGTQELRSNLRELSQGANTTTGEIIAIDRSNHSFATYSYEVDQHQFTNQAAGSSHGRGEPVVVYHSPRHPWISSLEEPREAYRDNLVGLVILLTLIAFIATLLAHRAR